MISLAENKNILIFGDSLSAGYGLGKNDAWPSLMRTRLAQQNRPYHIINHSIPGETAQGSTSRFKTSLDQTNPAIVILGLGANDGLRGLSLKAMKTHLQDMIDIAHAKKIQVLLIGMRLPPSYGIAYTDRFHQQYRQLAEKNGTAFVPFLMQGLGTGLEMYQADGLHPTARAQPQMMENVWQALQPILTP